MCVAEPGKLELNEDGRPRSLEVADSTLEAVLRREDMIEPAAHHLLRFVQ
jgi:hypothetical protein